MPTCMVADALRGGGRRRGVKYIIAAAVALVLAGCDVPPEVANHRKTINNTVRTVEIEGHKYIIFEGAYNGNIIHSESCPCKEGGAK